MRQERFPWGLGAILVLAIVGGIGFWVGSSSVAPVIVPVAAPVAPAPVAPAPVTPIYPAYAPHGGGFPLFPLFFGLIFVVVIFKFIRHAAWSGYQRGGPWAGGGSGGATYGPGGATYGPAGGPGGATYGSGGASYGPGGFGGRGSRSRHHRGHSGYGTGFDDDSVDQSQEGSQDTASASEATRPSDAARSGRPGFWNGRDVPPMVDEMFQRWHSRMHAEAEPETKGESDAPDTQSADDAGGSLNIPPAAQPTDQQN